MKQQKNDVFKHALFLNGYLPPGINKSLTEGFKIWFTIKIRYYERRK